MKWTPGNLVDTAALRDFEQLSLEVAGKEQALLLLGDRGAGKTWLSKVLPSRQPHIDLPGKILHVEFLASEDAKQALKVIAKALGIDGKIPNSTSELSPLLVQRMHQRRVSLLIIDNAHHLSPETLRLIAQFLCVKDKVTSGTDSPLQLHLLETPPSPVGLGILFTAVSVDPTQLNALKDSCDWRGVRQLSPLLFNEMAVLLNYFDERFESILTMAKIPESREMRCLANFYLLTQGTFARFERILRRLKPSLISTNVLQIELLEAILDDYATDNAKEFLPNEKLPPVSVF